MGDKRKDKLSDLSLFGFMSNALGGGGDRGQSFPRSDAEDLSRGLKFVPGEVTVARRKGEVVLFEQPCSHPCCWYWLFADKSRLHYWERSDYEQTAEANGFEKDGEGHYPDGVGACPECGNAHLTGGRVK